MTETLAGLPEDFKKELEDMTVPPDMSPQAEFRREDARNRIAGVDKDAILYDHRANEVVLVKKATNKRSEWRDGLCRKFFKYLRRGYLYGDALKKANVRWEKVKEAMEEDPALEDEYNAAVVANAEHRQRLREDEADRRAMKGTTTTQFDAKGRVVKKTLQPSDTMLKVQLEANNPEKYGKKDKGLTINNVNIDPGVANTLQQILAENRAETGGLLGKPVTPLAISPSPVDTEGDDGEE